MKNQEKKIIKEQKRITIQERMNQPLVETFKKK